MIPQEYGCILFTSPGAGIEAVPGLAICGCAKAGISSLMGSVAAEYGRQNICALSISQGGHASRRPDLVAEQAPGGVQPYNGAQPIGRLGRPEKMPMQRFNLQQTLRALLTALLCRWRALFMRSWRTLFDRRKPD